jgi:hypothetical protein
MEVERQGQGRKSWKDSPRSMCRQNRLLNLSVTAAAVGVFSRNLS